VKLDPFITFQDKGEYYILQTKEPFYVGRIIRFEHDQSLAFYDHEQHLQTAQVTGYRILIVFSGALNGNYILMHALWQKELTAVFSAMSTYYLNHRILPNVKKFKNFCI
jgi:hypothetical protein